MSNPSKVLPAQVDSKVLTLSQVEADELLFSIPSYQRPYVWPDEAVSKLFDDINAARENKEPHYFIGTVLTSVWTNKNKRNVYELIDGQQRTTTLMLIALAFRVVDSKSKIANISTLNNEPRLQFAIRDAVQQLMGSLAGLEKYVFPGHEAISVNPYLKRIFAALTVLKQRVHDLSLDDRAALADYIFTKVQWVNNIVPSQMDLNRLFATMNTAGIQLNQTDILKSKLLECVETEKPLYDAIWMSCEHMENYFERNVRKVFPNAPWNDIEAENLAAFSEEYFTETVESKDRIQGLSIAELAERLDTADKLEEVSEKESEKTEIEQQDVYCRSIVSFPLLLIHAYRIHIAISDINRKNREDVIPRVHADKLLETFEPLTNSTEEDVKQFIQLLWQVRYQFDRWVVKWVERDDSDEEQLRHTSISRSKSSGKYYINRQQKDLSGLVMLQSVRNFTGERSAQYWLTPFLAGLISQNITVEKQALSLLEKIDNQLSLVDEDGNETQKTASFAQARDRQPTTISWLSQTEYFDEPKGTRFKHYWFQKLEYVLWKDEKNRSKTEFKNYRITAKNSVEHVYPQNEEYNNKIKEKHLHAFGNLVLLSPGENSSYSNQAVEKKLVDFNAKSHYDSLKLKAMFKLLEAKGKWKPSQIREHQMEMLDLLTSHYEERG